MRVIDCDQHLVESRTMWAEHIDPSHRDDALALRDDDLGYTWLTWRDGRIELADVQLPGDTLAVGALRKRQRAGERSTQRYDEALPDHYWEPRTRASHLDAMQLDEAVLFPNYGLLWERPLSRDLDALTANMTAWNRWCTTVVADGGARLHPVAHLTLRDATWLERELASLSAGGVRLAMIAPALVDGRPLSHQDHDRIWSAFVDHDVTPVFHVANQPRVFDDAWYTDDADAFVPLLESVFLWTPPALALADLVVNGVLDRHPELRIGIIELSAVWVPLFLMMLDGAWDFAAKLNGQTPVELSLRPSDYVRRQVRVAAFSYEQPQRLIRQAGDLFMCCSDYPHSEGTATPVDDYERSGTPVTDEGAGLFARNIELLLGR